jgi:hypothetical protein
MTRFWFWIITASLMALPLAEALARPAADGGGA